MKRTMEWTPDTQPQDTFVVEWDDEKPDAEWVCSDECKKALEINQYKNREIVPELLALLPKSLKVNIMDEEGNSGEDFKIHPIFNVVDGQLIADFFPTLHESKDPALKKALENKFAEKAAERIF